MIIISAAEFIKNQAQRGAGEGEEIFVISVFPTTKHKSNNDNDNNDKLNDSLASYYLRERCGTRNRKNKRKVDNKRKDKQRRIAIQLLIGQLIFSFFLPFFLFLFHATSRPRISCIYIKCNF